MTTDKHIRRHAFQLFSQRKLSSKYSNLYIKGFNLFHPIFRHHRRKLTTT